MHCFLQQDDYMNYCRGGVYYCHQYSSGFSYTAVKSIIIIFDGFLVRSKFLWCSSMPISSFVVIVVAPTMRFASVNSRKPELCCKIKSHAFLLCLAGDLTALGELLGAFGLCPFLATALS